MEVLQVLVLITTVASCVALPDVIVQPGYAPVGAANPTYQHQQIYPTSHYVSQYPTPGSYLRPTYGDQVQVVEYPPSPGYHPVYVQDQPSSPGYQPVIVQEQPSMPGYHPVMVQEQPSSPGYHPVMVQEQPTPLHPHNLPAHPRSRRSSEKRAETGLADDVPASTAVNKVEMVVDSKDLKTRSIPSDVNDKHGNVHESKGVEGVVMPTIFKLNPDMMYRDLPEYKPVSYGKSSDQPVSVSIVHPEPKMSSPTQQRDAQPWLGSSNPTSNKPAESHEPEKARQQESAIVQTTPESKLRSMVQSVQEIRGNSGDASSDQTGDFRTNPQGRLQQMLGQMEHLGGERFDQSANSPHETARTHELDGQANPQQVGQMAGTTWANNGLVTQKVWLGRPDFTGAFNEQKTVTPHWRMIAPSYHAPQVYVYGEPILGISPYHAAYRNFPDPRPWPVTESSQEHATRHDEEDKSKHHDATTEQRSDNASKEPTHSEKSEYVSTVHAYTQESPQMLTSTYYGYPATFRSYGEPYSVQSYIIHQEESDGNPLVGTTLNRPHATHFVHKTPGIYNSNFGHKKFITPAYYSYSALQKGSPTYYKSYMPSSHYLTNYQTDATPRMIHYNTYI